MTRLFFASILGLAAMCLVGCSQSGSTIYAAAPAGHFQGSYTVSDGGRYTLYRVTQWNEKGQPTASTQVAAYDLHQGEKIGFNWVVDKSKMYAPDAHSDVEAYAGGHRMNLGPITSTSDRFFWADANGWDSYWNMQPMRTVERRVMLQ